MNEVANTDEQEFWSGPSGQSWVTHEAAQDRLLSEAADVVISRAGLAPGMRVLDIGCGTGALSVAAAERVGEDGRVLATDISAPMLDRAAERLRPYPHATTLLADAQTEDWPETGFDIAISRFGVMFFEDPAAAFANVARALRPGGRMVFAAWGPTARNLYWRDVPRVAIDRLGEPPKTPPNTPGPMGLADAAWSVGQFRNAGLTDVDCEEVEVGLPVNGTAAEAADLALRIGPAARVVRLFEATPGDVAAIRESIAGVLEPLHEGGVVRIPALLHLYTARKA